MCVCDYKMEYLGHDLTPDGIQPTDRLVKAREPAGRLHRWALTLQEYDFEIQYRPGRENAVADALSRGPGVGREGVSSEREETSEDPAIVPSNWLADEDKRATHQQQHEKSGGGHSDGTECELGEESPVDTRRQILGEEGAAAVRRVAGEMSNNRAIENGCGARSQMPRPQEDSTSDDEVDKAARCAVQTAVVWRVETAELGIIQFTDEDIKREQETSVVVQLLIQKGAYRGQRVFVEEDGLVHAEVDGGQSRVILPVVYWALAFKEAHDSIWAGHLRGPQTYERLQRMYWWPHMRGAVHSCVSACQDCGSRKARPKAVVPPLRSVRTGEVGDRWAVDVAGPLPVTDNGNRYVIAAVEYTTRYAVAAAVKELTAKSIARFLMEKVVMVFGPMREVMMDGTREFGSKAITKLLELMQTKQATPVPYRPNLLGLVKRFHRPWKDMVSLYIDEKQDDWDDFLPCALYAYNSSKHATHGYQPNKLMMGRNLRCPTELLRRSRLTYPHSSLQEYHEILMADLRKARELAALALQKEQARQALYYNQRNVRQCGTFHPGQLVWVYRPARGPKITKFGHRWRGRAKIIGEAGYDNYLVQMMESGAELVTHCSFLLSYYYPTHLLDKMAKDITMDLREEAIAAADIDQMMRRMEWR
ncbi:unnamed protein product [Phytophthora fragariaefolia]|uniref:Unnamed protein product n=1 Tax=Phytophthora fragariaefolia TaxID=1490495 RepID=A0A9W7D6I5_9STRA|nr:unnamed protein product [Phytophthora fragariaefolia]